MTFLHVVLIFFASPLYFLVRGKVIGFCFNAVCYGIAVLCLLSVIGIPVALVLWLIGVAHGAWNLRRDALQEHAKIFATEIGAALARRP